MAVSATGKSEKTGRSPYSAMHTGPGRALTAVYGVFALSATARAGYQLIREFDVAPIAYSLSAMAAVIYILATICLVIGNRVSHRIAVAACAIEFVGVIVVGILSHTHPEDFAKPSVWSNFGSGYGYIPLILPLIGLWWLLRVGRRAHRG
ncbi:MULTISPECIES: hypothetical protein [unclassified Brevibacterium]|uniref:hypothetical protein n=1 Tax=unclassified Brevibacterium TaxID=2614124 RepID=UPI0010928EA3|nr:hypothetical protein [Brevibacterium sp. S22]TGD31865.1 hypothetical protein EB835_07010 [Brevibacterium sp. S22]